MLNGQYQHLAGSTAHYIDNCLNVFVSNESSCEWLDVRLREIVERAVSDEFGDGVPVVFAVADTTTGDNSAEPDTNDYEPEQDNKPDYSDDRPVFQDFTKPYYSAENGQIIYTSYRTINSQITPQKQVIAPFTGCIDEKLIIYDDYERQVIYTVTGKKSGKPYTVKINSDDWSDPKKLAAVLLRYLPGKPPDTVRSLQTHWGPALTQLTDEQKMKIVKAINSTGWTPDCKAFVMPSGSIGSGYICKMDRGLDKELGGFGLKQANRQSHKRVTAAILALTGVYRPSVIYTLLAHVFLPPLIRWVGDSARYMYHIHTDTGNLKTELAKLMMAFYGPLDSSAITYKWSNTPIGAESRANVLKDCLMLIDDLKPNTIAENDKARWVAFVQAAVDAQGRKRATIGGKAAQSLPPRALLLSTGEAIPEAGEASYIARMLLAELNTQPPGRNHLLDHIKEIAPLFSGLMREYIVWLKKGNGCGALEEFKRLQADGPATAHARLAGNFAANRLGAVMLIKFLGEKGLLSTDRQAKYLDLHHQAITEVMTYTAECAAAERYSQRFAEGLRNAIGTGFAQLSTESIANRVGWQDDKHVYLLSGAKEIVDQFLRNSGQTMINISKTDLNKQLFDDGLVHSTTSRINRKKYDLQAIDPVDGARKMVIALHRERFYNPED